MARSSPAASFIKSGSYDDGDKHPPVSAAIPTLASVIPSPVLRRHPTGLCFFGYVPSDQQKGKDWGTNSGQQEYEIVKFVLTMEGAPARLQPTREPQDFAPGIHDP